MKKILVYSDEGAGPQSVRFLLKALREQHLTEQFEITRVNSDTIRGQRWEDDAALLIFPGGRDVYYHQALSGEPNARIRAYVEDGGKYLGICAGGYYGCAAIEFEKGFPLEVLGERELRFFPGLARGSAFGPNRFCYLSETGSCAAELTWLGEEKELSTACIYFNGGCAFVDADKHPNTAVLAHYQTLPGRPAAVVQCEVGRGRAVLSGVHPEYGAAYLSRAPDLPPGLLTTLEEGETSRKQWLHAILQRLIGEPWTTNS